VEKEVYKSSSDNGNSVKMALYLADTGKGPGHIGDKENNKFKSTYDKSMSDGNTIGKLKRLNNGIGNLIHDINVFTAHYQIVIKNLNDDQEAVAAAVKLIENSEASKILLPVQKAYFMGMLRSYHSFIVGHYGSSNNAISMTMETTNAIMNINNNIIKAFMTVSKMEEAGTI
jgi:hypothetical protein